MPVTCYIPCLPLGRTCTCNESSGVTVIDATSSRDRRFEFRPEWNKETDICLSISQNVKVTSWEDNDKNDSWRTSR
jgi:hypothetical protein